MTGKDAARRGRHRKLTAAGALLAVPLLALPAHGARAQLAALNDPFAPLGRATVSAAPAPPRLASGVSPDPFRGLGVMAAPESADYALIPLRAVRDPFGLLLAPAPPVKPGDRPGSGEGSDRKALKGAYTVMLSSIRASKGRASADAAARRFRRAGLPGVGVLLSSDHPSLRRGYYVVHSGSFTSSAAAQRSAAKARRFSRTAYAHRL